MLPPEQLQLYMTGSITFINQVYVAFRATVDTDYCAPGVESQDCRFFTRQDAPGMRWPTRRSMTPIVQAYDDLDSGRFRRLAGGDDRGPLPFPGRSPEAERR